MNRPEGEYIGDGVYISNDGFHVILRADDNVVYLDSRVLGALSEYVRKLNEARDRRE